MKDDKAIETATVGRDGVFGGMVGFGPHISKVPAIVQMPITAIRIPSLQFRKATQASGELQNLCIDCNGVSSGAGPHQCCMQCLCDKGRTRHACRWLLQTRETTGSDTITLTQEFLSRDARGSPHIGYRWCIETAKCRCDQLLTRKLLRSSILSCASLTILRMLETLLESSNAPFKRDSPSRGRHVLKLDASFTVEECAALMHSRPRRD